MAVYLENYHTEVFDKTVTLVGWEKPKGMRMEPLGITGYRFTIAAAEDWANKTVTGLQATKLIQQYPQWLRVTVT